MPACSVALLATIVLGQMLSVGAVFRKTLSVLGLAHCLFFFQTLDNRSIWHASQASNVISQPGSDFAEHDSDWLLVEIQHVVMIARSPFV